VSVTTESLLAAHTVLGSVSIERYRIVEPPVTSRHLKRPHRERYNKQWDSKTPNLIAPCLGGGCLAVLTLLRSDAGKLRLYRCHSGRDAVLGALRLSCDVSIWNLGRYEFMPSFRYEFIV
jgi:hypothetical protein